MLPGLQHFGGRGVCWSSGMRLGRMTSIQSFTWVYTNQTTSWLVHSLSIFGARTSHGQIWTQKIHHNPDLGEAITFPLIVYSAPLHRGRIQMTFFHGTPKWKAFQRYVARHLHATKSGQFLTFSGRESNCQFDSRPFFWP